MSTIKLKVFIPEQSEKTEPTNPSDSFSYKLTGVKLNGESLSKGELNNIIFNKNAKSVSFRIDANVEEFVSLEIGGVLFKRDVDYEVTSGSTIITLTGTGLKKLSSLGEGRHEAVFTFQGDKKVKTAITVNTSTERQIKPAEEQEGTAQEQKETAVSVPDTGAQQSHYEALTTGATVFGFAFLILSVIFLISRKLRNKRIKTSKTRVSYGRKSSYVLKSLVFVCFFMSLGCLIPLFMESSRAATDFDINDLPLSAPGEIGISPEDLDSDDIIVEKITIESDYSSYSGLDLSLYTTDARLTSESSSDTINSIQEAGPLESNTFGFSLENPSEDPSTAIFVPVSTTPGEASLSVDGPISAGESIDLYFAVRVNDLTPGAYELDLDLTAKRSDTIALQDINPFICANLEDETEYETVDIRDDQSYNIIKLADGNCWLAQNLDLDLSTEITLTPEDTDITEDYTPNVSTSTNPTEEWNYDDCLKHSEDDITKCKQYSYDIGDHAKGNLYNLFAADAGKAVADNNGHYPSDSSICPKGWKKADTNEYMTLFGQYLDHDDHYGGRGFDFDSGIVPSFFEETPGFYASQWFERMYGVDISGYQTSIDSTNELVFFQASPFSIIKQKRHHGEVILAAFDAFDNDTKSSGLALEGASVRCYASAISEVSVTYDKNTDDDVENLPESATLAVENNKITLSDKVPTRDHYEFLGWSTEDDDDPEYSQSAKITPTSASMTLYAVWGYAEPKAVLDYNGNLKFIYDSKDPSDNDPYKDIDRVCYLDDMDDFYSDCRGSNINSVSFEDSFKNYKPESTYAWFWGDENLTNVSGLENLNTSETTDMSQMFAHTTSLTSIDLPEGFGSAAENLNGMFYNSAIERLTLPAGFGSAATNMNSMFSNAEHLESISLPENFGRVAEDLNGMFYNTYSLTSIDLPEGFGSAAIDISSLFSHASNLSSLDLPGGFGSVAEIMQEAFAWTSSLTSINLPANFGSQADNISGIFAQTTALTSLNLPVGFGSVATNMFDTFSSATALEHINTYDPETGDVFYDQLPEGFGSVADDLSGMFYKNLELSELTFPAGFGSVATGMEDMFNKAQGFRTLTFPAGFGSQVTRTENMFKQDYNLEHIYIEPGTDWNTDAIVNSANMFLETYSLPNWNSGNDNNILNAHIGYKNGIPGYFTERS